MKQETILAEELEKDDAIFVKVNEEDCMKVVQHVWVNFNKNIVVTFDDGITMVFKPNKKFNIV